MKNYNFLFISFLVLCGLELSSQTLCSYNYRKRITIDPARVSGPSDLSNFPVLINIVTDNDLRTVANSGHVENASGFDIVFTAADGVTLLDFQRETYNATNGNYTAWVKIPLLSTTFSTSIYMYYGNTAIATDQSTNSVWSGYHGVWHFQANSFADASANGYTGTNNGTTNQATAAINNGRACNGSSWIELGAAFPNLNTNFSISAWINTTNRGTAGQRIFCDDVNNTGGYGFSLGDVGGANNGRLRFFSRGSTNVILDAPANSISANNTWFHVVAVADISGSIRRLFVNGVQVATITSVGWGTDAGNASIIGETAAGETGNRFNGQMDEVRVASSALSADWIATEYNNQSSPSTFYTISAEPKVWTGGTSSNMSTAGNWLNSSLPASGEDVIITSGANQPVLQASEQYRSLFIKTSANLSLSTFNLSIRSDITNCGTLTGASGGIILNSSPSFNQIQYLSGNGTYNLNNLTINNTFGTNPQVTLLKDVNLSGGLTLTSGIVNTSSTLILALGSGATSSSGSASSYVSGPMSKTGSGDFVFPVGKNGLWRRIAVSSLSASNTFGAEYFNSSPTGTNSIAAPLYNVSILEYWQLDRLAGAGSANVSLFWENAGTSAINNCPDLTVARYNGANWLEEPGTTSGGSSCSGAGTGTVTTTTVVATFSPFTFGSKTYLVNPLPVELSKFEGSCTSQGVLLVWSSESEHHFSHYEVESSSDGLNWHFVKMIPGTNSSIKQNYSSLMPLNSEPLQYYRLKQLDLDGAVKFGKIISVFCSKTTFDFRVFPNPAASEVYIEWLRSDSDLESRVRIVDLMGKTVYTELLPSGNSEYCLKLPFRLNPGVYMVQLETGAQSLSTQKLFIE